MSKALFIKIGCILSLVLFCWGARADTYDTHTLVAITVSGPEEVKDLYACKVDIVGRRGDVYKALLTDDQLASMTHQGFHITILYDEMAEDRRLWKEADEAAAAVAAKGPVESVVPGKLPSAYYTASHFTMTSPPAGSMMEHLLALYNAHTDICRLYNLGATQDGAYDIIAMKVSKNPDVVEAEPKIRIYGNIHGDEKIANMVACDVLDTILAGYVATPQDATSQKLVDGTEMWFIPMGNPYGNYNNTRYNSRSIDCNRNFWGPITSDDCYPQPCNGTPWTEAETKAIRDLTEAVTADHSKKRFAVSLTFHSGDELFNSIWNYTDSAPTDEPIFWSSRTGGSGCGSQDVPSCPTLAPHGLAQAYKDGCTQSGFWFTEGYDWYGTNGDTNDWSYGEWTGLDTTVELDTTKTPSISQMQLDLGYHRQAVLNYMLKAFQGIHGVMTDANTGAPLDGTVTATCTASSTITVPHAYQAIYTDPVAGDFHRVLQPGTYTVTCAATGYAPTVVTGLVVTADTKTACNCPMSTTRLAYSTSSLTDTCNGTGSGGDGILDPGETGTLQITLANGGPVGATNVSATLSTTTTGITITQATASYPTVAANGTAVNNAPNFQFQVASTVACGTVINFTLHAACDQGAWDSFFTVTVGNVVAGSTVTAYSESFASSTMPTGWTTKVVTGGTWAINSSGCTTYALRYPGTSAAADSWAFSPGQTLTSGVTYTLAFNEKVSSASYPQKLTVTAGASATAAGQTITVYTNTSLTNTACVAGGGTFTVPSTGTYYLGFHCTSAAASSRYLYVDDIALTYTSAATCTSHTCTVTCAAPTGLTNNTAADLNPCADTGVSVAWAADPTSWGGTGTKTYDVLRDGTAIQTGIAYGTTNYIDTTGVNGTSYTYSVRYNNGCGMSATTAGASAADNTCLAPGEVASGGSSSTAQSWTNGGAYASWPAVSGATIYTLYRGVPAGLPKLLTGLPNSCTRYSGASTSAATAENPGTDGVGFYWYLVTGSNGAGEGTAGSATAGSRIMSTSGSCY